MGFYHEPKVSWHSSFCPMCLSTLNNSPASSSLVWRCENGHTCLRFLFTWTGSEFWGKASLELRDTPASTSPVQKRNSCATLPGCRSLFLSFIPNILIFYRTSILLFLGYFLKIFLFHFTFSSQVSFPPLFSSPLPSPPAPLPSTSYGWGLPWEFNKVQHSKLRQDQDPPSCIKVKSGVPTYGKGSNKLAQAPGLNPGLTVRGPSDSSSFTTVSHKGKA